MSITTVSSRDFNQDVSKAKRAAFNGPVFITDRGHPAHVLLTIEAYQDITDQRKSIVELLAMPDAAEIDFEPPRLNGELYRPAVLRTTGVRLHAENLSSLARQCVAGDT